MTLITSSQTRLQPLPNQARLGAEMTGKKVALVDPVGTDAVAMPHYWTSADGVAWTDLGALPSIPTGGPDGALVPGGMQFSEIIHTSRQVIGGQEKLCIWFLCTASDPNYTATGYTYLGYYEAWWDGASSFTDARGGYLQALHATSAADVSPRGTAFFAGGQWHLAIYVASLALLDPAYAAPLYLVAGTPGAWKPALGPIATVAWGGGLTGIQGALDCAVTGGTMLVLIPDNYRGAISLLPVAVIGTTLTPNSAGIERVGSFGPVACALDNSNNLDILFSPGGTVLSHRKRTGTNTYGATTFLDTVTPDTWPAVVRDASSNDLWVLYTNSTRQANGEIKYSRLHGGSWDAPEYLAGGDPSGYTHPRLWSASPIANATYLVGTGTGLYALDFAGVSAGSGPGKPTGLTTGNVVGTSPTLSYTYVNSLISDPQGWRQYQLSHDAGATIDDDSGQVASSSTVIAVPSGTGLAYGVTWSWRVRTWDSLSNNGSGTASPWSDWTAITPVRGGTVTLDDIFSSGATSTTDITAPTHQVDVDWSQADTHDADAYQERIWQADGTTLIATGALTALSPVVASGASFRTAPWSVVLTNGATVKVEMRLRDAATGLWSSSGLHSYTVAYTPPPAPSDLVFTPHTDAGYGTLSWTNDGAAVADEVQMQDVTGTWIERSRGTLLTSVDVHPACGTAYSYRVRITDATGMVSDWTTLTDQILAGQGDLNLCWWFNDTETGDAIALGLADTSSNLGLNQMELERVFNPPGAGLPKTSYDARALWEEGDLAFQIMPNVLSDGTITDVDERVRRIEAMVGRHFTCLSREPNGIVKYVKLSKFRREPSDDLVYRRVQFSVRDTLPPKTPLL